MKNRETTHSEAFEKRLKSDEWNKRICCSVLNVRKERHSFRLRALAFAGFLVISALSVTTLVLEEQNADAQVITMLEQFTSDNLGSSLFDQ
ncbi:MAG: hypothetical protein U1F16_16935 [Turneriella sp.]